MLPESLVNQFLINFNLKINTIQTLCDKVDNYIAKQKDVEAVSTLNDIADELDDIDADAQILGLQYICNNVYYLKMIVGDLDLFPNFKIKLDELINTESLLNSLNPDNAENAYKKKILKATESIFSNNNVIDLHPDKQRYIPLSNLVQAGQRSNKNLDMRSGSDNAIDDVMVNDNKNHIHTVDEREHMNMVNNKNANIQNQANASVFDSVFIDNHNNVLEDNTIENQKDNEEIQNPQLNPNNAILRINKDTNQVQLSLLVKSNQSKYLDSCKRYYNSTIFGNHLLMGSDIYHSVFPSFMLFTNSQKILLQCLDDEHERQMLLKKNNSMVDNQTINVASNHEIDSDGDVNAQNHSNTTSIFTESSNHPNNDKLDSAAYNHNSDFLFFRKIMSSFIHETCVKINKTVEVNTVGFNDYLNYLNNEQYECVKVILIQLLKNALLHGIENIDTRIKNGKSERGMINISLDKDGNLMKFTFQDDGAGLNQNKIKEVAIKKGLISFENALKLDTKTCFQLAFKRNFSTEPYMKGNGLDLVKNKIKELNGKLNIKNNVNLGVSFTIQLDVFHLFLLLFCIKHLH